MKQNPSVLICHHGDADGIVSAMVCKSQLQKQLDNPSFQYLTFFYGMPEDLDALKAFDILYLVDASFSAETMNALYEFYKDNFVWIDHHISAINRLSKENSFIEGIRSVNDSACKLCFRFFVGRKEPLPVIVDLIDKWDMHRIESSDFQSMVIPANLIFAQFCTDIPQLENLDLLTTEGAKSAISSLGSILKTSNDKRIAKESKAVFVSHTIHKYVLAMLNSRVHSSEAIDFALKNNETFPTVDASLVFSIFRNEKAETMVRCSIYRIDGSKNSFNCSTFAESYGGGGHVSAAGFNIPLSSFEHDFLNK